MGARVLGTIRCDRPGCMAAVHADAAVHRVFSAMNAQDDCNAPVYLVWELPAGWVKRGDRFLCPDHEDERKVYSTMG